MFFRTFFYFLIYFVSFHIGATPERIPPQTKTPATNAIAKKKIIKYNIEIKTSYTNTITETDKNYIKKNIFEILMQTGRFNIILGHHYKKTRRDNLFSLSLQVNDALALKGRRKADLKAKLMLRDEVSNVLINFKEEKRILRNKLQKTIRAMVLGIFYGKNFNPETQQIYDNTIIPLKKKINKPHSVYNKIKKDSSDSTNDPDSENPDQEKPEVSEKKASKKPNKSKEDQPPKKKTKKKKKVEIADFDSPNLDLEKEVEPVPKKIKIPASWSNQFRMYGGSVAEEIVSDAVVQVGTTTSRLVLGADGHMGVAGRNHFYTYGAEIGMITGQHKFGFGPKYDFYGGYNIAPFGNLFSIGPSVSLSNLNYAAVFSAGNGERKFSGGGLWAGVKSEIFLEFSKFTILLDFRYQKVMVGKITSSIGDSVAASGTKFIMSARVTFWQHWGLGIRQESIEMTTLTNSNLLVNDNSLGTFLTYQ